MIKLRHYQEKIKAEIAEAWERFRVVLGVMPTGAGKTVTFASIVHDHKGSACIVVHRREIIAQISIALAKTETVHRIVAPPPTIAMIRRRHLALFNKSYIDPASSVGVASVQTLTSKSNEKDARLQAWLKQVTLAVFDEGHHYVEAGFWAKAVNVFSRAKVLLVTATPERADGTGLGKSHGGFAEVMVEGPSVAQLMKWGNLCEYVYYCPESDVDFTDIKLTKDGDFNAAAARARVVDSHLVGDIVQQYLQLAPGTQAIGFFESVATAEEVAAEFKAKGVPAVALSGQTEEHERERAIQAFERGEIKVMTNVGLFDEGFDVPACTTALLGCATMSLSKHMQMVGRVLRPAEGKDKAIIIDPVRNWERHGQVRWPRRWSLEGREKSDRENSDKVKQRVCLGCSQPYEAFRLECPYCHTLPDPPKRKAPEHVDGDLTMLDLDALDQLFAAREKANQSEAEFHKGLFARGVPPIGHQKELKRFRATKYRREVLHNLISWWVGMQPADRKPAEIQKRFFLRFGVDMLTVSALGLQETDDMIEKISLLFDRDLAG